MTLFLLFLQVQKWNPFLVLPFLALSFISPHSSHCRSPQQNKFWYKKQRHNKWIKKDPKWIHLEQPNRLRCKEKQQRRCLSWSSCFPPQTSWLMQYHQYYGGLLSLAPRVPLFHPHHAQEHTQSTNATNNRAFKDGCDITDFSKFGTRNPLIDDLHTDIYKHPQEIAYFHDARLEFGHIFINININFTFTVDSGNSLGNFLQLFIRFLKLCTNTTRIFSLHISRTSLSILSLGKQWKLRETSIVQAWGLRTHPRRWVLSPVTHLQC